jgi:hypothetical protein
VQIECCVNWLDALCAAQAEFSQATDVARSGLFAWLRTSTCSRSSRATREHPAMLTQASDVYVRRHVRSQIRKEAS